MVLVVQQGRKSFSGTQLQHGHPVGFLQLAKMHFVVLLDLQGFDAQGVLHPAFTILDLPLYLGGIRVKRPTSLGKGGLALKHLQDKDRLTNGRPAFDVFIHHGVHRRFLQR